MNTTLIHARPQPSPTRRSRTWRAWLAGAAERRARCRRISRRRARSARSGASSTSTMRKMGNPRGAVRRRPGLPAGPPRPGEPALHPIRRINLTVGHACPTARALELVSPLAQVHEGGAQDSVPPAASPGRIVENVHDRRGHRTCTKIPAPRWHEHDGGYYIGTGVMVIMRDPDTGWISDGAYRVQAHGPNVATVTCSKGKHGDLIQQPLSRARTSRALVAVVCGMHHRAVHGGGAGDPAWQERVRRRRRAAGRAGAGDPGRRGPAFRFPHTPRSPSRASSIPTTRLTKARSASGPATTPAA